MSPDPLITTTDLEKQYPLNRSLFGHGRTFLRAVDGVSLSIGRGELLGLVGESGSGKSTLGRLLMALEQPTSGTVTFAGADMSHLRPPEMRRFRAKAQMVFQDPFSSLNPRMTIEETLAMPLRFNAPELDRTARRRKVKETLARVGLPESYLARFPHEFSGGQRQRMGVARALMVEPEFIMADEPVSALDVSVQAQILNLFADIRRQMNLTMLFVTHDLSVVGHIADRIAVMYLGRIVEIGPTRALFTRPRHPYTEALLSAAPDPVPGRGRRRITLEGDMPSPTDPPSGCPFRTRCRFAQPACAETRPELTEREPGHAAACIRGDINLVPAIDERTVAPA